MIAVISCNPSVVQDDRPLPLATDGEIAELNLEGAGRYAWSRFARDPRAPGVSEAIVDMERLKVQFLGDVDALDRLEMVASRFAHTDPAFPAPLIQAQVASTVHRFEDAREHLARAARMGAPRDAVEHQSLAIDQACGRELDKVLDARRRIVMASARLENLVPLGALLADLECFAEADAVYQEAFYSYDGTSPFPLAWVCFQLGLLWAELMPLPTWDLAALWYRRAISYFPPYVRARVHLAEICISQDRTADAELLLLPVLSSKDPEVRWRLATALYAQGRFEEAGIALAAARRGFNAILEKHPLAFADHGAEFYAGSGNDPKRALEFARANVANRPTRRAINQARAIASIANRAAAASGPHQECSAVIPAGPSQ